MFWAIAGWLPANSGMGCLPPALRRRARAIQALRGQAVCTTCVIPLAKRLSLHHPLPRRTAMRAASTLTCARFDTALHKSGRERSEMRATKRARIDSPYVPQIAPSGMILTIIHGHRWTRETIGARCPFTIFIIRLTETSTPPVHITSLRLPHRIVVVVIAHTFAQQEDMFVCGCGAISNRLGHDGTTVGRAERQPLGPDDIAAKVPTLSLQRESHTPGDSYQVFGLEIDRLAMVIPAARRFRGNNTLSPAF